MLDVLVEDFFILPVIDYDSVFINLCGYCDCCVTLNFGNCVDILSVSDFRRGENKLSVNGNGRIGLSVALLEGNGEGAVSAVVGVDAGWNNLSARVANNIDVIVINCCANGYGEVAINFLSGCAVKLNLIGIAVAVL